MKTPIFTKTHNVKSKRTISKDKVFWEQHGIVLTSPEGYQRIVLNTLPISNGSALELYLFPAEKKKA